MLKDKPEDELPKMVVRPYTPISDPAAKGYLDLVVKVGSRMRGEGPVARDAQPTHNPSAMRGGLFRWTAMWGNLHPVQRDLVPLTLSL